MKKRIIACAALLLSLGTLLGACSKEDGKKTEDNSSKYDRKAMLTNYADNYVIPAYDALYLELGKLKTATDQFTANPGTTTLAGLQEAWKAAYFVWQKTDMLEFGPAEEASLRMFMNTYPTTISKINANITAGAYNLDEFGNKDAQGFAAVDYLITGIAATSAGVVDYYTTDAQATARKKYLGDLVASMTTRIATVRNQWSSGYRNTFVNNTGTDAGSSTSRMVNAFVLYYERYLRSGKIGLPVGAMTGVSAPQLSEAYYTPEIGRDLALTAFRSVQNFYKGKSFDGSQDGQGMYDYLQAIGTKDNDGTLMADVIVTEMGQAETALQGMNVSIKAAVQNDRQNVINVYQQLQEIVPLLKVDMVSAFGISITYVDNDGD